MISSVLYATFRFLFWAYFKLFFKLKVFGKENLPREGPFIFASNHSSYFDPILLGVSSGRFLNYLARDTLFRTRCSAWAMSNVRSIPIKRRGGDFAALKAALNILKEGEPLVIFPEGTRTVDGLLKKGKRGVGFLVAKTASPVIPAYIKGAREAFPKWAKRPRFLPIKVYIGRPIEFYDRDGNPTADLDGKVDEGDLPFLISQQIMNRIQELKEEIERQ